MTTLVPVEERSEIGAARRCVAAIAAGLGLSEDARGRAAIVATELASNLCRHGREGRLLLRGRLEDPHPSLELLAVDCGPGMRNIARCLEDGYSTGGTAGQGLGAVRRLAQDFDIASAEGAGTVVLARIREAHAPPPSALRVGAVCLPMPGQAQCGDGWAWRDEPDGGSLLVFDGLGHGPEAATAAAAALDAFASASVRDPADLLLLVHQRTSGTRGGAGAIARIDHRAGTLQYAGAGNISGTLIDRDGGRRGLASHNGILGSVVGRLKNFDYPWATGDLLVLHSDGLQSRWSLDRFPFLVGRDPALLAAILSRDFSRGRDDQTVVVVRDSRGGRPAP